MCTIAAEAGVDDEARSALMQALARLVWESRASRERVWRCWIGSIVKRWCRSTVARGSAGRGDLLLGLTEWTERVQRGWEAGRLSLSFRDVDRQDWIEQTRKAAENPDDPERFADDRLVPIDDPTADIGWSADPPSGPGEAPNGDEIVLAGHGDAARDSRRRICPWRRRMAC